MENKTRAFLFLGPIFALSVLIFFRGNRNGEMEILEKERHLHILLKGAEQLKRRYEKGDGEALIEKGILRCPNIPKPSLLHRQNDSKCNPHYLNCFLASKKPNLQNQFPVHFEGRDYLIQVNPVDEEKFSKKRYYRVTSSTNSSGKKIPHYAIQTLPLHKWAEEGRPPRPIRGYLSRYLSPQKGLRLSRT